MAWYNGQTSFLTLIIVEMKTSIHSVCLGKEKTINN